MAHQQWQGSHSYYTAWNSQYNNNQQQPYPYNHSQHEQYDPSYPYYYPQQQQHVQEQYPYTTASSQPPPPHSSVIHQLHEQTQHQQALGALAAASITTALQGGQNNSAMWYSHQQQPTQAYTQHHPYPPQRAIVAYNDLEPAPAPPRPQGYVKCRVCILQQDLIYLDYAGHFVVIDGTGHRLQKNNMNATISNATCVAFRVSKLSWMNTWR